MKTEKEKMISGEYYNAFDPELVKGRRTAKNLLHSLNVKEYRVTKRAREILKELIPNELVFISNRLFIVIMVTI
jgi:maltose O-acetyltransferase